MLHCSHFICFLVLAPFAGSERPHYRQMSSLEEVGRDSLVSFSFLCCFFGKPIAVLSLRFGLLRFRIAGGMCMASKFPSAAGCFSTTSGTSTKGGSSSTGGTSATAGISTKGGSSSTGGTSATSGISTKGGSSPTGTSTKGGSSLTALRVSHTSSPLLHESYNC